MAKNKDKKKGQKKEEKQNVEVQVSVAAGEQAAAVDSAAAEQPRPKMSRKDFDKEMEKLQVELVKMQEWVKASDSAGRQSPRAHRARPGRGRNRHR